MIARLSHEIIKYYIRKIPKSDINCEFRISNLDEDQFTIITYLLSENIPPV